jgi:uncharacterized protein YutD
MKGTVKPEMTSNVTVEQRNREFHTFAHSDDSGDKCELDERYFDVLNHHNM